MSTNQIPAIPKEILGPFIFSYLKKEDRSIRLVCKLWNELALKYFTLDSKVITNWLDKAIKYKDENFAINLISNININLQTKKKFEIQIIQLVARRGNLIAMEKLLGDLKIDPSVDENVAIHEAAFNGHLEVVKKLLKDTRVNPSESRLWSVPLDSAIGADHLEVVKELLKDPRVNPTKGEIQWASEHGCIEMMRELLKHPKINKLEILIWACEKGYIAIVKELINSGIDLNNPEVESGIDPSMNHNIAIEVASKYGHLEIVKELLKDSRVDPSDDYVKTNGAILFASANGHLEVVKELLKDSRVDPSANNQEALQCAIKNNYLEVVKELLKDSRVDPSANGQAALKAAKTNRRKKIEEELLKDPRVDPSALKRATKRAKK
ncbi:MAG: ankyrin repeat domain-containing protein [Chlamydiae bacterium]|nr:ankyrin repeat domain-containing protein [Chlamydiota bacterium]